MKTNIKNAANRELKNEFRSLNQVIKFFKEQATKLPAVKTFLKENKFDVKNLTVAFICNNWTVKIDGQCAYNVTIQGAKTTKIKTYWSCWDILTTISKVSSTSK
jgi:hypothetical protein